MASQVSIVINQGLTMRTRSTSSGTKSRFTVEIEAEPILHTFNHARLGAEPALAIKQAITQQIQGIGESVLPSTFLQRKYAATAFARSSRWAIKRYSGGKTGATPPGVTAQLFNDSGRLAKGIFVRQNVADDSFTVNVPANRFNMATFKNQGDLVNMINRLRSLVPGLSNPTSLWSVPSVRLALAKTIDTVLITKLGKAYSDETALRAELAKRGFEVLQQVIELIASFGGE